MIRNIVALFLLIFIIIYPYISYFKPSYKDFNLSEKIEVEIYGEVLKEGFYKIDRGAKLKDLIELAGLKENADLSSLNQNKILCHNDRYIVLAKSENTNKVNINTADINTLMSIKGIGEKTALKIIEYRENIGYFSDLEELLEIDGIGFKKYEKILPRITI